MRMKETIDSAFLDPVIVKHVMDAVTEVFSVQAKTDIEFVTIQPVSPGGARQTYDVASVVGLVGTKLKGSLALCFPESTFLVVAGRIMREEFKSLTAENVDTAGELLNMVSGVVRRKVNSSGYDFAPSIPSVVMGKELELNPGEKLGLMRLRVNTGFGPFFLEFTMRRDGSEKA